MDNKGQTIKTKKVVQHWIETSDSDYKTMVELFESKRYHWSLVIGHITIEKLLRGCKEIKVTF